MAQISARLEAGTRVRITNDRHEWFADEPLEEEGTDTGPTPFELLLGSLAACTAITLRVYAKHKGIEIASLSLAYEHDRIEVDGSRRERITSHVAIGGDFDAAQRARLEQIVTRCAIHKALAGNVELVDNVVFEELAAA